jgi:hypothetical protein
VEGGFAEKKLPFDIWRQREGSSFRPNTNQRGTGNSRNELKLPRQEQKLREACFSSRFYYVIAYL